MNYKISGALKKNRTTLIVFAILWLFIAIVLIAPMSYAYAQSIVNGKLDIGMFTKNYISNPFEALGKLVINGKILVYLKALGGWTLTCLIFLIIGLVRTAPKHQYTDIEHGSSNWSEHGEQYTILSNKNGIILGEKNYLPVDKRGNINVLVVGRIRIW